MKRLMIALLSTSAIAFAVPAAAHPEDHATTAEAPWNNGGATYADFNREYQQVWDGVQHGLSDHSYTREQGDRFLATMREIRARADEMQREGRYDPQLTHVRLAQLHNEMDAAHERGHDRLDHAGQVTTYAQFSREYRHVWDMIHHGMSDGSYTRTEGLQFARTLRRIRDRVEAMQRGGRYDPQDAQARLEQLHVAMHDAHERGHARMGQYAPRNPG